ncbi:MAG: universal stress protein [Dehalococcoidales bacterium]|nr:universal stress protein [Dehalococcoidales bacterium]
MFKRILVPLDGSRFSSSALRYASEIAQRFEAEVILIQIVKPATPVSVVPSMVSGMESPATAEITAQAALAEDKRNVARAKRYLNGKVRGIKSQGIKVSYRTEVGEPALSIIRFAQKGHIDLVVMTTRGKGGLRRAVLGSIADEVVRKSGKPVLVIRSQVRNKK